MSPHPPFRVVRVVTEIFAEVAQHTARRIGMIVMAALGMIDRVPAGAVGVALQQPQFADQPRVIGYPYEPAGKQRHALQIDRALGQLHVAHASFGPGAGDSLRALTSSKDGVAVCMGVSVNGLPQW